MTYGPYRQLVRESGENKFYFGNDTEGATDLQETAAVQLGMMDRVLADRWDLSVAVVTNIAAERAEEMRLR